MSKRRKDLLSFWPLDSAFRQDDFRSCQKGQAKTCTFNLMAWLVKGHHESRVNVLFCCVASWAYVMLCVYVLWYVMFWRPTHLSTRFRPGASTFCSIITRISSRRTPFLEAAANTVDTDVSDCLRYHSRANWIPRKGHLPPRCKEYLEQMYSSDRLQNHQYQVHPALCSSSSQTQRPRVERLWRLDVAQGPREEYQSPRQRREPCSPIAIPLHYSWAIRASKSHVINSDSAQWHTFQNCETRRSLALKTWQLPKSYGIIRDPFSRPIGISS